MKTLFLIPARAGSKGIPGKNHKELLGKPLILYSFEVARMLSTDENICVSTDDEIILQLLKEKGYEPPFIRPKSLSTDFVSSYDVILHALNFYAQKHLFYDIVVLLQPTSPLRKASHVKEAMDLYDDSLDAVVSVSESSQNPYYNLYEDNVDGFLNISKGNGNFLRRQDIPPVWQFNGAIYIFNVKSLNKGYFSSFKKIKKYIMPQVFSIDLDTPFDWKMLETYMRNNE